MTQKHSNTFYIGLMCVSLIFAVAFLVIGYNEVNTEGWYALCWILASLLCLSSMTYTKNKWDMDSMFSWD